MPGVCVVDGCRRPVVYPSRGWCGTHYARWWRKGTVDRAPRVPVVCAVDGCDVPALARGWCSAHYQRWSAHGDPEAAPVRRQRGDAGTPRPGRGPGGVCRHCGDPLPADAAPSRAYHPECRKASEAARRRVTEPRSVPCAWCGDPVTVGGSRGKYHPECARLHRRTAYRAKSRGTDYATERVNTLTGDLRPSRVSPCADCGVPVTSPGWGQPNTRCPEHARRHLRRLERVRDNGTDYQTEVAREAGLPCDLCGQLVPLNRAGSRAKATYCAGCNRSGRGRRHRNIRNMYGATAAEAALIMAATRCATCGVTFTNRRPIHVDHDHATGHIRGVLCGSCNSALGYVRDDPATAVALAAYLLGHRSVGGGVVAFPTT